MPETRVFSVEELTARLQAYAEASARRDLRLVAVLGVLIAFGFFATLALRNQPLLLRSVTVTWVLSLVGLAAYVLTTTRAWHREHSVHCAHCDRSLRPSMGVLDDLVSGRPAPPTIQCPRCGAVIASEGRPA